MKLRELTGYLDDYLRIADVPDYRGAYNGLQVEGGDELTKVVTAVDACAAVIDAAAAAGASILLVHHGLFWGDTAPLTGARFQRVAALISAGISVYSAHLPLDVHPEVGNNALLTRALGLHPEGTFGAFEGHPIGIWSHGKGTREELAAQLAEVLRATPLLMPFGPAVPKRIGVITGGAGSMIKVAHEAGVDTFITGEGAHHTFFDAEELGINVFYGGHYATETFGVRSLGEHISHRFGLAVEFIDHPTGL